MRSPLFLFTQTTAYAKRYWHKLRNGFRGVNATSSTNSTLSTNSITLTTQRRLRAGFNLLLKLSAAVYVAFCILFLTLRYAVLPNIDHYKVEVEQMATHVVGLPVRIAAIEASWNGLRPRLTLSDLAIYDKQGRQVLHLPRVAATVGWSSLMVADIRLHRLRIERPDIAIQRDANGNLLVAGVLIDMHKKSDGRGRDWVLSQSEIVIHDGRLRWNDSVPHDGKAVPELVLEHVDLTLNNYWQHHRIALRATPPAAWAAPIDIRAAFDHPRFTKKIADPSLWFGQLYVDLRQADLMAWKPYLDYPIELTQAKGALRAWLDFDRAKITGVTADVSLENVTTRLRSDLPWLNLAQATGRISAQGEFDANAANLANRDTRAFWAKKHTIALKDFSWRSADGVRVPNLTVSESYRPANNNQPGLIEINAKQLDLQALANIAEHLPLTAQQRQQLTALAPRGQLQDFIVEWQGDYAKGAAAKNEDLNNQDAETASSGLFSGASYRIKGKFAHLSLRMPPLNNGSVAAGPNVNADMSGNAVPAAPGFDNLTGSVEATEQGGLLELESKQIKFAFPGHFVDPIFPFEKLNTQLSWTFPQRDHLLLNIAKLQIERPDLDITLKGKYQLPLHRVQTASTGVSSSATSTFTSASANSAALGYADLSAHIERFEIGQIGRYLPLDMHQDFRLWLTGALQSGVLRDATFKLKGELADFPYHTMTAREKPKGELSLIGKIEKGKMDYAPGMTPPAWPLLEEIDGTFAWNRTRIEVKAQHAMTQGVKLSDVQVTVPDFWHGKAILEVDGNAAGTLQDLLNYTNHSPVAAWLGHFTEPINASGAAKLMLKLQVPLAQPAAAKVQGGLQFINNDITLQPLTPPFSSANGKLEFTEKGVELKDIKAKFLGGQVVLSGGTQRDETIAIKAAGNLSTDGLRRDFAAGPLQKLFAYIRGGARYNAIIAIKKRHPEIMVESNLQGIALNFPAPLHKAANEVLPFKFELTTLPSAADASVISDEMKLSLGSAISARYLRQKTGEKGNWRVVQGGVGVNTPAPRPDDGVLANVNLKLLDLDAWRQVVASMSTPLAPRNRVEAGNRNIEKSGEKSGEKNAPDTFGIAQYIEPDVLAARATELIVLGKKLNNVVVGASHQNNEQRSVWQANLDSEQISGYLTWNESASGYGMGKVTARLTSLIVPSSAASDVTDLLETNNTTTQMPALDVTAENFELFGKKLGQLELVANNVRIGGGGNGGNNGSGANSGNGASTREWRIHKLFLKNPDAELNATGTWAAKDKTSLTYALEINNAGKLLDRFGFANVLQGGQGKMEGELSWKGLPFSLDIPSLSGNIELDIKAGQFLKVEPGAAKLLGVLSLQSLRRRLSLDFRDVFSEGFAFDGITAQATVTQGIARTDNFKMRGVTATVLIDGSADIAQESQNLHAVVLPEINAGTASIVYGLAVNPVIGVGTFLAQLFLRDPLSRAFTYEYQVTGPWKDPVVTKLKEQTNPSHKSSNNAVPGN